MVIPAGGLPKWTRASPTVRAYRFDGSGAQRAPWADAGFAALCRPHTPCRGAACRSRRCTPDSYWLPLKWYTPIASVAALSERLVHLQIMQRKFIGMRLPSLSLRGLEGAVAISQYHAGSQGSSGEIATAFPRLHPKGTSSRFALRAPRPLRGLAMARQAGAAVHQRSSAVELSSTRRSLPVKGTPHP